MTVTKFNKVEICLNKNGAFNFFYENHYYAARSLKGACMTLAHLMGITCVIR